MVRITGGSEMKFFVIIILVTLPLIVVSAAELVPLYPLNHRESDRNHLTQPGSSLDWWLTHVDDNAEYYLGSGAENDTFFIVFEIPYPCSLYYAEFQWFDSGAVDFFVAEVSEEALELYPLGQAPDRGISPVSPIGELMTDITELTVEGTQNWEIAEIEPNFSFYQSIENDKIGIGFIKNSEMPHPLADRMDSKGIRYTYTWFGGPWMATYPHDWGAYSSNIQGGTVVEVMARLWVNFYPCMPILINDVSQHCNTFGLSGPFDITCALIDDDPGITEDDSVSLVYQVNNGEPISVELEDVVPLNDGIFGASISGDFFPGDTITYWIFTIDDVGLVNSTENNPKSFCILEPQNENADILMVQNGGIHICYQQLFETLAVEWESWSMVINLGIDEATICYGWNAVFIDNIWPGLEESSLSEPVASFLDSGGQMFYSTADLGFVEDDTMGFQAEDFEFDYLGINTLYGNPAVFDTVYYGIEGNPVTNEFADDPLSYYYSSVLPPDKFDPVPGGGALFGISNGKHYASTVENGFKVFFSSFNAVNLNQYPGSGNSEGFVTLMTNILDWFEIPYTGVESKPSQSVAEFTLHQNYPNPFNAGTTINFNLAANNELKITVYNIYGQLVETLFDGRENAGHHQVKWEAGDLASGIYICKMETPSVNLSRKMLLLK